MTNDEIMNLTGDALDCAVAVAQGWHKEDDNQAVGHKAWFDSNNLSVCLVAFYHPSKNGQQLLDVMEREHISAIWHKENKNWFAIQEHDEFLFKATGKTINEAVLRCYLLSKKGD
jgi:hypothetical protein